MKLGKADKLIKRIKEKCNYYYLKPIHEKPTVGHVLILDDLVPEFHIIVDCDSKGDSKWIELKVFNEKYTKLDKVYKTEQEFFNDLDKFLLKSYIEKHNRIQKDYESNCTKYNTSFFTHLIRKSGYFLWLYAFDRTTKRFKNGKDTPGIWKKVRNILWPVWKDATKEELSAIYKEYVEFQRTNKNK